MPLLLNINIKNKHSKTTALFHFLVSLLGGKNMH